MVKPLFMFKNLTRLTFFSAAHIADIAGIINHGLQLLTKAGLDSDQLHSIH